MVKHYDNSLRGYSFEIHKQDNFVCVYCGLDGKIWPNWLYLSSDHLLPKGYSGREKPKYIVTACVFCNVLHNKTVFDLENADGKLKSKTELIEQKKILVLERRNQYKEFWIKNVKSQNDEKKNRNSDMVTDKEIVEACMPILKNAQKEWGTVFLNAYQIWGILNNKENSFCKQMREAYGNEVGEGAGERVTPVVRISQALSRSKKIEHYYMDGMLTEFRIGDKDIKPAYIYDVFRLQADDKLGDKN